MVPRSVSQAADTLQDLMQAFLETGRRFAGAWITDDGQTLGVAVVWKYWASTAAQLAAGMHRTHPQVPFRVVKVHYSDVELHAMQEQVWRLVYGDNRSSSIPGDVTLAAVGTVVQQNRLCAHLMRGHDDVAYRIRARFGSWIIITDDGSVSKAA